MSVSDILTTLLAAVPDSYQKTVGYPTYDLLAAAALRMQGTDEEVAAMRAALDPENLTIRLRGERTRGGALPPLANHPRRWT